jgi:uncharacterized membrane protein AbrB (regulator of aidB expression)
MIGTTIEKAGVDADSVAFCQSVRIVSLRILVSIVVSIVVESPASAETMLSNPESIPRLRGKWESYLT